LNKKLLLSLLGILIFVIVSAAFYNGYTTFNMIKNGISVEAEVVDVKYIRGTTSNRGSYYPVFRYEYNGKVFSRQSRMGSRPPAFSQGELTTLIISPENPRTFLPDNFSLRWRTTLIPLAISLILMLIFWLIKTSPEDSLKK
jgi:hypothetical protein